MAYDPTRLKLGKLPSKRDPRTLKLASFTTAALPPPPPTSRRDDGLTDWGIMGNNDYGNCVICTAAHAIMAWYHATRGIMAKIPDNKVIALSRTMGAINGYSILERNKYWRTAGMWTNKIRAFAQIDTNDLTTLRTAINYFGCADIGLALPAAWQDDDPWDCGIGPQFRPYTWGGHSVPLVGYDANYFYCATWGRTQRITPCAIKTYCDEAFALIDPAWICESGQTLDGLNLEALDAALAAVTR
jgi:hypothetical protein